MNGFKYECLVYRKTTMIVYVIVQVVDGSKELTYNENLF